MWIRLDVYTRFSKGYEADVKTMIAVYKKKDFKTIQRFILKSLSPVRCKSYKRTFSELKACVFLHVFLNARQFAQRIYPYLPKAFEMLDFCGAKLHIPVFPDVCPFLRNAKMEARDCVRRHTLGNNTILH